MPGPSQEELAARKRLTINAETVGNAASTDFPGHWPGENHEWNLDYFKNTFKVQFHTSSPHDSSFSLIGLDTSVANAFRRILLSEIPTLAIEDVFIYQNTSIIQDEVLAHRLGLIPLKGSRMGLNWLKWYQKPSEEDPGSGTPSDYNCVILHLKARCEWQDKGRELAIQGETDPDKLYVNHNVYARDMTWQPIGKQGDVFGGEPIEATNPGILIAKMRPGQEINLMMHAMKGIGADHAKFSPVATASYRLLPTIEILRPIVGAEARKFARCFPRGVVGFEEVAREEAESGDLEVRGKEGEIKAVVVDAMRDTVSRECLRHAEFRDKVRLGRVRDHFIFRVESTGQWESDELFVESVRLLKVKCQRVRRGLDEMMK